MKHIFFILAALLFLAGCKQAEITNNPTSKILSQSSMQLNLDKNIYHSNEQMNITVQIETNKTAENANIKVYGIYASRNRLNLSKTTNLSEGNNLILFEYKTPSCNTCSGIRPGMYDITAEVEYNGTMTKETKQIEIQQ